MKEPPSKKLRLLDKIPIGDISDLRDIPDDRKRTPILIEIAPNLLFSSEQQRHQCFQDQLQEEFADCRIDSFSSYSRKEERMDHEHKLFEGISIFLFSFTFSSSI